MLVLSSTAAILANGTSRTGRNRYVPWGQQKQEKIMFVQGSTACSIAETWGTEQMEWPRVQGERTEQHREMAPGITK